VQMRKCEDVQMRRCVNVQITRYELLTTNY
jgi:hypothetical protein